MKIARYLATIFSVLLICLNAFASENIRVLIVDEVHPGIPGKNEKLQKIGSLQGDLFLMGTQYTGNLDVWKGDSGLYIVNELPLEEYIKDVVAAEIPADWDMEALKAQAVVSRTYALYQKNINGNSLYDIASSVLHQAYKGKKPVARIAYAVSATGDEILTFDGRPAEALYHSTCGGMTENPEEVFGRKYPYLRAVESSCELSPYSKWERKIPRDEIEKALNISGIKGISVKSRTSTNRVRQLSLKTSSEDTAINATDFRKALGWSRLPSTNFEISGDNEVIVFEGSGYGHGVGLCQWSALEMAQQGKSYREILSLFYPGTIIQLYENH